MMQIIVPLAGPDFILPDGSVKAMADVDGMPLLRRALGSRPWAGAVAADDHVFVMADHAETRAFAADALADWYPGARVVFLSHSTKGAALSALGGVTSATGAGHPVIVDLADILYASELDPSAVFAADPSCGGIALTFRSDAPAYSYLRQDADGQFVEAAEKRVISDQASAGTYIFSGAEVLLRAIAHALEHAGSQTHNGLFYVCPLFNGVRAQGRGVRLSPVRDVVDIKLTGTT